MSEGKWFSVPRGRKDPQTAQEPEAASGWKGQKGQCTTGCSEDRGHLAAGRQDRDFKVEAQSHFAEAGKRSHRIHDHKPESEPGLRHLYTEHAHSEHRKREAN